MKTAVAEAKHEASANFVMPPVGLGDIVLHYVDSSCEPQPALVVCQGTRTLSVLQFSVGFSNGRPFDGVRHKDDPDYSESGEGGFWVHTEKDRYLYDVVAAKKEIEAEEAEQESKPKKGA